jgi:protein required for attachment to host cells
MATWILVANRTGARVFHHRGRQLTLLKTFDFPAGRVRDQDLEAGQQARSYDSHGAGRQAQGRDSSPHEHAARQFARDLAGHLEQARLDNATNKIVLVAEPHFLGLLREAIDKDTLTLVTASVPKDLAAVAPDHLSEHLGSAQL